MTISTKLKHFLRQKRIDYELIPHPYSSSSMLSAEAAHVPGDQLAKSVMLEDGHGYMMVVLPASRYVEFSRLRAQLHRRLSLATEDELTSLFDDCEVGALPPLGEAYGLSVVLDDSLRKHKDIFFEAGDHRELVHISGLDFQALMANTEHGDFTRRI